MKKIIEEFYKNVERYPNKTAVCDEKALISYKDLGQMVSKLSSYFSSVGIDSKTKIAVEMNNTIESVSLILATANAGAAIIPLNPKLHKKGIVKLLKATDSSYLIASLNIIMDIKNEYNQIYSIDVNELFTKHLKMERVNSRVSAEISKDIKYSAPFIITATSGSTGEPKPIVLSQENKVRRIEAHIDLYNLTNEDIILAATPLHHSLAERLVLLPLFIGATSIILNVFTPNKWIETVKEKNVTFTIAVSSQLAQVVMIEEMKEITSLKNLVSSFALLEESVKRKLVRDLNCNIHEIYGTSEVSTVSNLDFHNSKDKVKSVGAPLKEADIKIVSNNMECKVREKGEIVCKTDLICTDYYGQGNLFKDSFWNGYFKTGDLGYLDDDGFLYFVDRIKDIIISGGITIYPTDIETAFLAMDGVKECAAVAIPDEKLGEVVGVALVTAHVISKKEIRKYCIANLADFQQPRRIIFLDKLPRNAMNKVFKKEIKRLLLEGSL